MMGCYQRQWRTLAATLTDLESTIDWGANPWELFQYTTLKHPPLMASPSKNCGRPRCHQDRTLFGCEHPGQCVETAKMLINSILPKWNPTMLIWIYVKSSL
ncbi:hypothetical protein K438DRAFT_1801426 [Mycena galopus ATCC 62051]|nr:hypothetical protein K438DRAFT_1801426 [Mycena galopus ATCC 62051]